MPCERKVEDTKGVISSRKWKKDKKTNTGGQKATLKIMDSATRDLARNGKQFMSTLSMYIC